MECNRAAPEGGTPQLIVNGSGGNLSAGLNTRTEEAAHWLAPVAAMALRALAGAPTWPIWPGAVRYVQGTTLKAAGLSLRQVFNSRLPVCHRQRP